MNIIDACKVGNAKELEVIIAEGNVDLNQKDYADHTPLYYAMENDSPELVKLLLAEPSTVLGLADRDGFTALMAACEYGSEECIRLYLEDKRCSVHIVNMKTNHNDGKYQGTTALCNALIKGHVKIAKLLLSIPKINLNIVGWIRNDRDKYLYVNPLVTAIKAGLEDVVKLLLENPNTKLENAPLYRVCCKDEYQDETITPESVRCIEMLLNNERYKDEEKLINEDKVEGKTALFYAMSDGNADIVKLILSNQNTKFIGPIGEVLGTACEKNKFECVKRFVEDERCTLDLIKTSEALHRAVQSDNEELLQLILNLPGIDLNAPNQDGQSPLHVALITDKPNTLSLLLAQSGIEFDTFNSEGRAALFEACYLGQANRSIRVYLADERCTPEIVNRQDEKMQMSALKYAIKERAPDNVKALLEYPGIDNDLSDYGDGCPILYALEEDDSDLVELFLQCKIRLDHDIGYWDQSPHKFPLIKACMLDRIRSVKLILDDERCTEQIINQTDGRGSSALLHAVLAGHPRIVRALLAKPQTDFNAANSDGMSPIMCAMSRDIWLGNTKRKPNENDSAIVELLLGKDNLKLDVTAKGLTCLHYACSRSGGEASVEAFINDERCTSDILNKLCPDGRTALMMAVIFRHVDVVEILVEKSETDCETGNPLAYAIENNLPEIVEILLRKTNPKVKLEFQKTFEDFGLIKACAGNYLEVVKLLVGDERLTPEILSLTNGLGDTALMTAVVYGKKKIVEEIVRHYGVQEQYKNEAGQNAWDLAKQHRPAIAKMMKAICSDANLS